MPYSHLKLCGWLGADAKQKQLASMFPALRQMAPQLFTAAPRTEAVCLYKAFDEVLGDNWIGYPSQETGDCTSFGHGHGNDLLQCIALGLGHGSAYFETDTEFLYGASRETAGILGGPQGSYGAATVKAMMQMGMVSRDMLGPAGEYSGDRANAWGTTGPPEIAKAKAVHYKLGAAAQVHTWEDYVRAITNGYPVSTCSKLGFSPVRDGQGFCVSQGHWGHCMVCAGVRFDRPGGLILQSWGPDIPTGPTTLDQPSWSFWVDMSTLEEMLAEGDSWALSDSPAFDPQKLPKSWTYDVAA